MSKLNRITPSVAALTLALSLPAGLLAETKEKEDESSKSTGSSSAASVQSKDNEKEDEGTKSASYGTAANIQSTARPFGLSIVDKVMDAGSDDRSGHFSEKVLPGMTKLLNTQLGERMQANSSAMLLDPSQLKLQNAADVRIYFVGEGAAYHNSLGYTTDGSGSYKSDTAKLIFPDASSTVSSYDPGSSVRRTSSEPLLPGDFVNLGKVGAGSQLDFFLMSNGASNSKTTFSTQQSHNADGINHVVSFAYAMADSPYLILGFEDMYGGGDHDYNDAIFAVDIGLANVKAILSTPEPATYLTLGSFAGLAVWARRRQIRAAA